MKRIDSVDVFKVAAICAVILIHTKPFHEGPFTDIKAFFLLDVILNQLARFAVPFFFILSGYFWGAKVREGASIENVSRGMLKRFGLLFVIWSFIYPFFYDLQAFQRYGILGPLKTAYWRWLRLSADPLRILMQGTRVHLWFLVALLCAIGITMIFVKRRAIKSLIVVASALYVVGLCAKAYADSPLGLSLAFNTRNGPFFSTLPFVTGYLLSRYKSTEEWLRVGFFIFVVGTVMHFTEIYLLGKIYGTDYFQDYVFGTLFMGLGAVVMALSGHPLVSSKRLSAIGKYTLGIYVVHLIFVDMLRPIDAAVFHPLWEIGYDVIVLVLSYCVVKVLSAWPGTRKLVGSA